MSTERLLAHYEKIADAPNAILRLRRFVLDLAVRGKLVPQDQNDEPAGKAPASVKSPHDLPETWRWVRIGDQLELLNGMAFKPTDWRPSGIRIVRIQNLNNPGAPFNYCDPTLARERSLIDNGSFLISWSGTPGTSFGAFIWDRGPAVLNQHIFRCDFKTNAFSPEYLRLAINGRLDEMIGKAHGGVGLQHITRGKLEAMLIALAPLAEQHRIVAKVHELMTVCDRLEAARAEREAMRDKFTAATLARLNEPDPDTFHDDTRFALDALPALTARADQIKRLRQTILNLAVRGKLVPQNSSDEPVPGLLKRVPSLPKPARYEKRSRELIPGDCGLSINHPGTELPSGWLWVPLVQIARLESGHTPSRNRPEWWGGDVPWIGLVDARLHNNGTIFRTIQTTNEKGLANSSARLLPKGTVCFSRTASVGYVVIMGRPMATSQDFVNWVPTEAISSSWLQLVMMAERPAIGRFSKGAVHQTIYYPAWLSMHIALPPLAEQRRIIAKVDDLMALCDRLEASLAGADNTRRRLLEALLAEALVSDTERELQAAE
jgi:type I restriction enzyme S subunit